MTPLLLALVASGILPQADADRIERSMDPDAARLHAEGLLTEAFQRGLSLQQRRLLGLIDDTQGQPSARELERLWEQEDELLFASVGEELRSVAVERAVMSSVNTTNPDMWKLVNQNVLDWTDSYYLNADLDAFGSIPNLNLTSRTQFGSVFRDWQRGELGIAGRTATGELRQGLDALIAGLEPTFGVSRAKKIAVTENTRIFSQSELAAGSVNDFIAGWIYNTANDAKVSELCRPANGTVMLKGQTTFPDGLGPPPRHVLCRSGITQITGPALEALRREGLAQ